MFRTNVEVALVYVESHAREALEHRLRDEWVATRHCNIQSVSRSNCTTVGVAHCHHNTASTYLRKMEVNAIWMHRFCIPSTLLRKKNTTATMASNDGIMKKANMNFS